MNAWRLERARPEAYKGDDHIYAEIIDWNPGHPADYNKDAFVGGPTRAGFPDMGQIHVYHSKLWRSIIDESLTKKVAEYPADCKAIDAQLDGKRPPNVSLMVFQKLILAGQLNANTRSQTP